MRATRGSQRRESPVKARSCATLPAIYEAHQAEVDRLGAAPKSTLARSAR
jgi:hypothetical protein